MHVLIIDDLRILALPVPAQVTYARTLADALTRLRERHWDQVWFDHDLGLVDGHATEAIVVAHELEAAAHGAADPVSVGEVIVHTDNPVGRDRLVATLRDYPCRVVAAASVTVGTVSD